MSRMFLLSLFLLCGAVYGESGYRIVHPDGTVEFTDQPREGAEEIELRQAPTVHFEPTKPSVGTSPAAKKAMPTGNYTTLTITSPKADENIWSSGEAVSVTVSLQPALAQGHLVRILLDGAQVASGSSTSVQLPQVFRGTHTLGAEVADSNGKVLISSPVITFHLHQRSILK